MFIGVLAQAEWDASLCSIGFTLRYICIHLAMLVSAQGSTPSPIYCWGSTAGNGCCLHAWVMDRACRA